MADAAAGARIRPARSEDADGIRRVVTEAFGAGEGGHGPQVAAILDELGATGLLRVSLVTEADGEVVGHVATSAAWLDARDRLVDVWVLSPLSVHPDRQGDGLGTALLAAAVAEADASTVPLLFLEGSPSYYAARGFVVARDLGLLPPTRRLPVAAFHVRTLPSWDGSVGALVYPDVWWRHDATGLRDPLLAELETVHGTWDD